MKSRFKVLFCICMIILIISVFTPVNAAVQPINLDAELQPMFTYIDTFYSIFDVSSGGIATINVYLSSSNADRTKISAKIQQYYNGRWYDIKTWTKTSYTSSCSLNKSYSIVSGFTYRLVSYGYVYNNGSLLESTHSTSQNKYY
ncbi:MAG: hypothetical protein ACOWWR_06090 [Eubacteriales bacterium]